MTNQVQKNVAINMGLVADAGSIAGILEDRDGVLGGHQGFQIYPNIYTVGWLK